MNDGNGCTPKIWDGNHFGCVAPRGFHKQTELAIFVFFVNNTTLTMLTYLTYLSILCFSLQEIISFVGDTSAF